MISRALLRHISIGAAGLGLSILLLYLGIEMLTRCDYMTYSNGVRVTFVGYKNGETHVPHWAFLAFLMALFPSALLMRALAPSPARRPFRILLALTFIWSLALAICVAILPFLFHHHTLNRYLLLGIGVGLTSWSAFWAIDAAARN